MDEILRYTDLAHAIQMARAHDLSDRDIIRVLTGSMSHEEARKVAQRAAPLLEITVKEFMELREKRLSCFDFRNKTFAVSLLQKFRLAKGFATLGRLGFNGFEKLRSRLIKEISFTLVLGLLGYRHDSI
jgi:hypothetical protein